VVTAQLGEGGHPLGSGQVTPGHGFLDQDKALEDRLGDRVGGYPAESSTAVDKAEARVDQGTAVSLPTGRWEPHYVRSVVLADVVVIAIVSVFGAIFTAARHPHTDLPYTLTAVTDLALLGALAVSRAWELRILGQGAEEFRRLGRGVAGAGIVIALAGLALEKPEVRPWVFGVVPLVLVLGALTRYSLRRVLHRYRRKGRCMLPVLVAGRVDEVADLIERTRREEYNGWKIEAACTPGGLGEDGSGEVLGVPVVGDLEDLPERVVRGGYRVVAVVPDARWTRRRLQQLSWQLETAPVDLVIAPTLAEVTGPRLHVSPVFGLPLLRVSAPRFSGGKWLVKNAMDRLAAAVGLVLVAPLMITIAAAIWLHDRGPVFYRQTRVGRDGSTFNMIKFRSMIMNADARLPELAADNQGAGPMFKLRRDPRITAVGGFLRKYSLDELPQLFNVLAGSMSLVGPRPPLPAEAAVYPTYMRRRLKVKPGLTGLWQVSGRSDLSWAESERLDVRYVENWSLALDLAILWKTLGAVLKGEGAY
jgi:exopolysaccharide biosynthesis polyprenyl glycosylphosphotransferase